LIPSIFYLQSFLSYVPGDGSGGSRFPSYGRGITYPRVIAVLLKLALSLKDSNYGMNGDAGPGGPPGLPAFNRVPASRTSVVISGCSYFSLFNV
jgi:hypothetical protein